MYQKLTRPSPVHRAAPASRQSADASWLVATQHALWPAHCPVTRRWQRPADQVTAGSLRRFAGGVGARCDAAVPGPAVQRHFAVAIIFWLHQNGSDSCVVAATRLHIAAMPVVITSHSLAIDHFGQRLRPEANTAHRLIMATAVADIASKIVAVAGAARGRCRLPPTLVATGPVTSACWRGPGQSTVTAGRKWLSSQGAVRVAGFALAGSTGTCAVSVTGKASARLTSRL